MSGWISVQKHIQVGLTVNSQSVTQTLPCVGLFPEQAALGVPGPAAGRPQECVARHPAVCPVWRGGWGTSRSRNPWGAAGTKWGLVGLWRPGPVSLSAPGSPGQWRGNKTLASLNNLVLCLSKKQPCVTSTGWRCSRARSKVVPWKKVWRLKRSRVLSRRMGVLHKS